MTYNAMGFKIPIGSDLKGISGKFYSFYAYDFNTDLVDDAKGIEGVIYIGKVEENSITERFCLRKQKDIFNSKIEFSEIVPNKEEYCYLIYDKDGDLDQVIADIIDNKEYHFKELQNNNNEKHLSK